MVSTQFSNEIAMLKYYILTGTIFFVFLFCFLCSAKITFCIKNNGKINIRVSFDFLDYCKTGIWLLM